MSGYQTVLLVDRIRERADKLGFMLCYPKHGWGSDRGSDYVAVKPKDQDSLPIYSRDAQFFTGTLVELSSFFDGIEWSRNYDLMLRLSDEKKRERKEQNVRNERLLKSLSTGDSNEKDLVMT